eukprot:TRINITY_DN4316_c0_g1_i1.p6 TRINITY_DN4316_c0_g1~~TRINITY_DN4316_c0_g1_i1.p6  ORF type:complete len:119 (+),score=26.43 TRINITY_DN4316_c0_g1_i1:198-554(+)
MQAARRVPKYVWLQRDFYNAFFGWRTLVTFCYGIVEQGAKVVVPTFMLLFLCRYSKPRVVKDSQRCRLSERKFKPNEVKPVSYTHLTLPTILLVQISVVAVSLKKKKNQDAKHNSTAR